MNFDAQYDFGKKILEKKKILKTLSFAHEVKTYIVRGRGFPGGRSCNWNSTSIVSTTHRGFTIIFGCKQKNMAEIRTKCDFPQLEASMENKQKQTAALFILDDKQLFVIAFPWSPKIIKKHRKKFF